MKVSIKSLGCKINQFDSGVLRDSLTASGALIAGRDEPADVYVINTCTVTKKSDYHCRQAIRRAVREKPDGAVVVVTGCYAQTSPDEILAIPGVDHVVGNDRRDELPGVILGGAADKTRPRSAVQSVMRGSRAFLKVQEGCGRRCSYCIVPSARGKGKSAAKEHVLAAAADLLGRGYHEIVLTGVNLGAYGADLPGRRGLAGLVSELVALPGLGRLRLSSIEPMEFSDGLMEIISGHAGGRLCRHFHVPLQSADDRVLDSMGRGYDAGGYFDVIDMLDKAAPGACLGADVIVGYPLEDEESFMRTYRRIERSKINYLHVFSYSPRPGTPAYGLGDPVPGDEKKRRSRALRELAAAKNAAFTEGFIGETMEVVAEDKQGKFSGLTDNYIRVAFDGGGLEARKAVNVRLRAMKDGRMTGVVER